MLDVNLSFNDKSFEVIKIESKLLPDKVILANSFAYDFNFLLQILDLPYQMLGKIGKVTIRFNDNISYLWGVILSYTQDSYYIFTTPLYLLKTKYYDLVYQNIAIEKLITSIFTRINLNLNLKFLISNNTIYPTILNHKLTEFEFLQQILALNCLHIAFKFDANDFTIFITDSYAKIKNRKVIDYNFYNKITTKGNAFTYELMQTLSNSYLTIKCNLINLQPGETIKLLNHPIKVMNNDYIISDYAFAANCAHHPKSIIDYKSILYLIPLTTKINPKFTYVMPSTLLANTYSFTQSGCYQIKYQKSYFDTNYNEQQEINKIKPFCDYAQDFNFPIRNNNLCLVGFNYNSLLKPIILNTIYNNNFKEPVTKDNSYEQIISSDYNKMQFFALSNDYKISLNNADTNYINLQKINDINQIDIISNKSCVNFKSDTVKHKADYSFNHCYEALLYANKLNYKAFNINFSAVENFNCQNFHANFTINNKFEILAKNCQEKAINHKIITDEYNLQAKTINFQTEKFTLDGKTITIGNKKAKIIISKSGISITAVSVSFSDGTTPNILPMMK